MGLIGGSQGRLNEGNSWDGTGLFRDCDPRLCRRLGKLHASNRKVWELRVAKARRGEGETLFEDLTQLIRDAGTELTLVD